jgi:hypothetical protein
MFSHIVVKIPNMKLHEHASGRSEQEQYRKLVGAFGMRARLTMMMHVRTVTYIRRTM